MTVNHGWRALAEAQRSLPTTRVAHVADGPVEYLTAGDGRPAIVLLGGVGLPHQVWALIFPQLASISTVFVHNRHGVGASAAPRRAQTGTAIVETLRAALAAARVPPPYVLVGHALGGLYAILYARLFPHELAGLVLLEATHPDDHALERGYRFLPRAFTRTLMATATTRSRRNAERGSWRTRRSRSPRLAPVPTCRSLSSPAPRRRPGWPCRQRAYRATPPASSNSSPCQRSASRSSRPTADISLR